MDSGPDTLSPIFLSAQAKQGLDSLGQTGKPAGSYRSIIEKSESAGARYCLPSSEGNDGLRPKKYLQAYLVSVK